MKSLIFIGITITLWLWISVSCTIMRALHPDMTETELFINLPRAFFLLEPHKEVHSDKEPTEEKPEPLDEYIVIPFWGERGDNGQSIGTGEFSE